MKTHAAIGADILSTIDFPYPVEPIVRYHHEMWNGKGYPEGISGEAIPLGARILSVVDCFDALTSDRPYRRALTREEAIEVIVERRGTQYDPLVVDTFVAACDRLVDAVNDQRDDELESGREVEIREVIASRWPWVVGRPWSDRLHVLLGFGCFHVGGRIDLARCREAHVRDLDVGNDADRPGHVDDTLDRIVHPPVAVVFNRRAVWRPTAKATPRMRFVLGRPETIRTDDGADGQTFLVREMTMARQIGLDEEPHS